MPLHNYKGKIPFIITNLINRLEERNADQQEGIFRLSGRKSEVDRICTFMDRAPVTDWTQFEDMDNNVIACALKKYLQNLSSFDPLIGKDISDEVNSTIQLFSEDPTIYSRLKNLLEHSPLTRRNALAYVMHYLKKIADNSGVNNMNSYNLSVCFTLAIFPQTDTIASGNSMKAFELFINDFEQIFDPSWYDAANILTPGDIEKLSAPIIDISDAKNEQMRRMVKKSSLIPYDRSMLSTFFLIERPNRPPPSPPHSPSQSPAVIPE
ncbi:RhoGAP domain containing protein [Histomonas meleagridis]|nr:RhoGAP domain containing protein [Histomonas meleagridis]